jgi:PAS domain S-box-containing protein
MTEVKEKRIIFNKEGQNIENDVFLMWGDSEELKNFPISSKRTFKKSKKKLDFKRVKKPLWIQFFLDEMVLGEGRVLVIENVNIKDVVFYVGGKKKKGDFLYHRYPSFFIPKKAGLMTLRVKSHSELKLPLRLYSLRGFNKKIVNEEKLFNFFVGFFFILFLYNLFSYFKTDLLNYIIFCCYSFVTFGFLLLFSHYLNGSWILGKVMNVLGSLSGTLLLYFGENFFKNLDEKLKKHFKRLMILGGGACFLAMILPKENGVMMVLLINVINWGHLVYASIVQTGANKRAAKYILIGATILFFSLFFQIGGGLSFIPTHFFVQNALLIGGAFILFIFSLGLMESFKIQKDETHKRAEDLNDANHKLKLLYRKIEKTNASLENKVKARTNELFSSLNETKEILNNMRQAVFSIDENSKVIYPVSKYSEEIFGENIVGKNVCEEIFEDDFREKLGFVLSVSMGMDEYQFESLDDVIPKQTKIRSKKDGIEKIVKILLSSILNDQHEVCRVMFIVEDMSEEEKLKEEVRISQEKAELRIQILQEIVSNSRSDFRIFIKEVFETLGEWENDEGAKRSLHTIKGSSRFFNLETLSHKVHNLESEYESSKMEEIKEKLTVLLNSYKESAQEVFGEEILSGSGDVAEEFIEVPKTKFEVALHSAKEMTSAKSVLRIFSNLMMSEIKGELEKLKGTVYRESKKLSKKITFKVTGVEALFGRTVAKIIRESVIHLLNNSISHGIEKEGTIEIKLVRKRPDIILSLQDNGKGINVEKIYNKAIEKGLIDSKKDFLTEDEKIRLIFEPGFSTAENVSEMSGRGVGMDVVKNNIEGLGGSITIKTELNKGTEFVLKIPNL